MKRRPPATVRVLTLPVLHPDAVRVEIECPASTTGMTMVPSAVLQFTTAQLVTGATLEHEARCGDCDTRAAHEQGDSGWRHAAEEAVAQIVASARGRSVAARRN